jgi:hypothetical protein
MKPPVVFLFLIEFLGLETADESIIVHGVSVPPDSYNLFVILTHEYKEYLGRYEKIR